MLNKHLILLKKTKISQNFRTFKKNTLYKNPFINKQNLRYNRNINPFFTHNLLI